MVNLVESIFGTTSKSEVTQQKTKTPDQEKAINDLVTLLSGEVQNFDVSGELSDTDKQVQNIFSGIIEGLSGLGETVKGATQFDKGAVDELFNTTVRDPLLKDFSENIIPNISARYGDQFFSSERQNVEGRAIEQLMQSLSGERAKLVSSERDRNLQALSILPNIIAGTGGLTEQGDVKRKRKSQDIDMRNAIIQMLLGGTGQNTFENIATVTPGSEGLLSTFLSGVGSGYGKSLGSK